MEEKDYKLAWPGLNAYTEDDQGRFFGRDKEIVLLQDCIIEEPLCIVFGPSGVGKTSLLLAGVLPQLRAHGYFPVYLRLDHGSHAKSYSTQIVDAFLQAAQKYRLELKEVCPALRSDREEALWEWFHRHEFQNALKKTICPILVFDQFEEIFTLGMDKEASEKWFDDLSDVCSNSVPEAVADDMADSDEEIGFPLNEQNWRVVISLREDFLPRLEERTTDYPVFSHRRLSVSPFRKEQALEVILNAGKGIVNEKVAKNIVDYVGGISGKIETPLLSLFCARLDLMRQKIGLSEITPELVEGNKSDILVHFYDEAIGGLSEQSRDYLEEALLNQNGYRKPLQIEEAEQNGVKEQELNELVEKRLLHVIVRDNVSWIEYSHDILASVVCARREQRQRMHHWKVMQKRVSLLAFLSIMFLLLAIWAIHAYYVANINLTLARKQEQRAREEEKLAKANEKRAIQAEAIAKNNEIISKENEKRAIQAEAIAKNNEIISKENEKRAIEAEAIAKKNERWAKEQNEIMNKAFEFLKEILKSANPNRNGVQKITLSEALKKKKQDVKNIENWQLRALLSLEIGKLFDDHGEYEDAYEFISIAVALYTKNMPYTNEAGDACNIMGLIQLHQNNNEDALKFFNHALIHYSKNNKESLIISRIYRNIAVAYVNLKKYDDAMQYSKKSLEICIKLKKDLDIAKAYNNLGLIYYKREKEGDNEKCLECHQKALELKLNNLVNYDDMELASCFYNLGLAYLRFNNREQAYQNIEKAYNIVVKMYDESHPLCRLYKSRLDKIY